MPVLERLACDVLPFLVQSRGSSERAQVAVGLTVQLETAYSLQVVCTRFRDGIAMAGAWTKFRPALEILASVHADEISSASKRKQNHITRHLQAKGSDIRILEIDLNPSSRTSLRQVPSVDAEVLLVAAKCCPNIEEFVLEGLWASIVNLEIGLAAVVSSFLQLRSLTLKLPPGVNGDLILFAVACTRLPSLARLFLAGAEGPMEMGIKLLAECSNVPALTVVSLNICQHLGLGVPGELGRIASLRSIGLAGSKLSANGIRELCAGQAELVSLKVPWVSKERFGFVGSKILDLDELMPDAIYDEISGESLQDLDFSLCSNLEDRSLFRIVRQCPNLRNLSLQGTSVTAKGLQYLRKYCSVLEVLGLSLCDEHLDDANLSCQSDLPLGLVCLDISGTKISPANVDQWMAHAPRLRGLGAHKEWADEGTLMRWKSQYASLHVQLDPETCIRSQYFTLQLV
eukprot:gnl/MRDRNA2_/MRDRNA2_103038_c0_seq1.p1 gnl/MRDRNA2_/MRDRNA2_103038_c0~~gnl/MRDRNA2_/MRDRNA2_103038_c0_seq1.p1  ORF type:complete len:458 (+),score=49.54 gnl/MRDRNA2_/MRDRNA2_103038_c0_seq1:86-1459(+)